MTSFPVQEIMTLKSGKFIFSAKYSNERLLPHIIESGILFQTINDLPILPHVASHIQEELIKKSIFGTAALEGNPLSENKVMEILNNQSNIQDTEKAKKEIQNLKNAYLYLKTIMPLGKPIEISEKLIRDIHKSITLDIDHDNNIPGNFRSHLVKVGDNSHGGIYTPPKHLKDISILVKSFIDWINCEQMVSIYPVLRAALSHFHLGLMHPFSDGNGRTARIIEALILQTAGIKYVPVMLSNFYYRNMDDYYWVFSKTITNKEHDVTDFLEFVLKGTIESLKEIKEQITSIIRILTLKDFYKYMRNEKKISRRQYDLLSILIENINYQFTLTDLKKYQPLLILYRDVSPSTIRRDMIKLLELNLLKITNEQIFQININALD